MTVFHGSIAVAPLKPGSPFAEDPPPQVFHGSIAVARVT
jgi:hypothetical protein